MNKVSVIVPAYNCEGCISRAVESLINQTYRDVEIIVVNDGSTDNTRALLEGYKNKILLIDKPNGGVASARNAGLDAASGDYIMFVDSDDYVDTDCLSRVMREGADIVRFEDVWEYSDGTTKRVRNMFSEETKVKREQFAKYVYPCFLDGIAFNSVWGNLFSARIIGDTRFRLDMKTAEDAVFAIDVFSRAQSFVYVPNVLYHYTISGGGLTGKAVSVMEKYRCNYLLSKYIIKMLPLWGMNTPYNRIRALLRLVKLTADKLKRG